jgi:hypothetical protein
MKINEIGNIVINRKIKYKMKIVLEFVRLIHNESIIR